MPTYLVTPDTPRVPAARFAAVDLFDLGQQVAHHLARHKHLRRGLHFDAQIGDDHGAIHQPGLSRPLTFSITKEN